MGKAWTQEEDKFVLKNISKMTYKKIGEEIGRTEYAVANRVWEIKKDMNKERTKKWFNEYLPILEPEEGKRQIIKKLKIDEKKAEKLYKKWRYAYVNRIM
ncbi:hypothetical protein ACIR03_02605 [Clostridium cochlearium]|uniref:hypothetical protein n=1 Tax=Clostridium cochlearium TaxID=1494 RepID=UPI00156FDC3E|nr:hypothetical protein [Clostridium cochlearium]MBV1816880.1 hypothetical protein [Bacteroidales bacterium MSK.15.36]MCG4571755.1 hypothetical protein [Clostridium cochlearium]MCG4579084.1 hypothetical protein [Clostridium cochlearium]NSJ90158.1 hypothetical protein [Coprococcus sp. MSK.21.13]